MSEDRPEEFHEASDLACDVLVVVVNEIEREQFEQQARECFSSFIRVRSSRTGYKYISLLNECSRRLNMIQVQEGIIGEDAAIIKIYNAALEARPSSLILVGMAFGYPHRQKRFDEDVPEPIHMGDVLVSEGIVFYDRRSVREEHHLPFYSYGDRVFKSESSQTLMDEMLGVQVACLGGPKMHRGWMVTGSSYIGSPVYRDHLRSLLYKRLKIEIIGGDMEAGALLSMPKTLRLQWLVVKGVSDYADLMITGRDVPRGVSLQNKVRACRNASTLVLRWFTGLGQASDPEDDY